MIADTFAQEELAWPDGAAELRAEVRGFLRAELEAGSFVPHCNSWMEAHDPSFSRKLGERGWLGVTWPKQYGGHELTGLHRFVITEEVLAAGAPVAAHWTADRQTGPSLLRYGTEEQRERFLPAIAAGECYFAIGMSEPDSGSDLASASVRAEQVDGGWRLNGTKVWTSHASRAHYVLALCRTGEPGEDRHQGLSQFIIDLSSEGVTANPIRLLSGHPHFDELVLEDAFVPDELVLGEIGNGWEQVTSELAYERSGPERVLSTFPLLVELVRERYAEATGAPAVELGHLLGRLWAARQMSLAIAMKLQAGVTPDTEAALVKDLGTGLERELTEVARLLVPVEPDLGADDPYRRLLAEAVLSGPGFTLRGGTTEILRTIVTRGLGVR